MNILQTCSVELQTEDRKKEMMFLIWAAPTDLCPAGLETESFSPGFGEGGQCQKQVWSSFEVSFHLKHSCKFGIRSGDRAVFILKWKHGFELFSMAYYGTPENCIRRAPARWWAALGFFVAGDLGKSWRMTAFSGFTDEGAGQRCQASPKVTWWCAFLMMIKIIITVFLLV